MGYGVESVAYMFPIFEESVKAKIVSLSTFFSRSQYISDIVLCNLRIFFFFGMGSGVESVAYMFPIHEESVKAKIVIYGAVWTAIQ